MSLEQKIEILNNEKIPQVYEAGQKSMVDESKVIEKTVSGTGFVNINDVSEIPHNVKVQLSSDTITDFSNMSLTVCGKNLFPNFITDTTLNKGSTVKVNSDGSLTVHKVAGEQIMLHTEVFFPKGTYTLSNGMGVKHLICVQAFGKTTQDSPSVKVEWGGGTTRLYLYASNTAEGDITLKPQIEFGDTSTPYEPYKSTTYTPNADGTVNIKSISPIMNIYTNETDINLSASYHKSYGMQTEYDNFWDTYQNYGERTDYGNAFAGEGWTVENLKPKYNIIPTSAYMMFRVSRLKIDLVEYLKDLGIALDFSSAVNLQYVFGNSYFTHIGVFDTRKSTNTTVLDNTFSNSPYLVTIDKIILKPNATKQFENTFTSCASLENIAFEGEINRDGLNLQWSTKLSKESITSIINALSSTTTGLKVTLSKTAVNNAFNINVDDVTTYPEGSEYYTLRHSKDNWTISYV